MARPSQPSEPGGDRRRPRAGARTTRRGLFLSGGALALGAAQARAAATVPQPLRDLAAGGSFGAGAWPTAAHDLDASREAAGAVGVRPRWRAHFPGGVPATAAIAGGHVYAASARGAVAALDLGSGRQLWRRELGTAAYGSGEGKRHLGFFGGVAVTAKGVIVAAERVYCLDRASGKLLWATAPLRTKTSDDYFWGPPTVAGDVVLLGSGSGGELPTARGRLSAYRLHDGGPVWSTPTVPQGANGGGVIAPASVDLTAGLVYVATGSPYEKVPGSNPGTCSLIAMRLNDGAIVWQDQIFPGDARGFDFNSAPVIAGSRLIATNKDGIYAWDRSTRRRAWHRRITDPLAGGAKSAGPTGGPEGGPIASDGRHVFVLSNDTTTEGTVAAALRAKDGKLAWRTPLPAPNFAAPALAGGRLHVAGSDGTLRVLDSGSGRVVKEAPLGEPSSAAPAIAAGRLVVGTGAAPYIPGASLVCLG
jgi:outer membrane protein assembly factor BamB